MPNDDAPTLTAEETQAMAAPPPGSDASQIADMVAAVEAAMTGGTAAPAAAPAGDKGTPPPAAPPAATAGEVPPPPATEPDLPPLTAAIRAREQARKTIDDAKTEAQRVADEYMSKARADADRYLAEQRAKFESEQSDWRTRLRQNPLEAITGSGMDVDELVADVARAGSPEWKLIKQQQAKLATLEATLNETKQWRSQQEEQAKQHQAWQAQQQRESTKREFTGMATADKSPQLRALAEQVHKLAGPFVPHMRSADDWIMLFGDHAYDQAVASGQQVAKLSDLIQHLEYVARGQSASTPPNGQVGDPAHGQAAGKSAHGQRAPGTRTLSASAASERRAAPKRSSEMSEDELRAASVADVEELFRAKR